jgi:hypothetical protein
MTDPFDTKKSFSDALSEVRTFDFFTEVYPKSIFEKIAKSLEQGKKTQPPKTIFLPSRKLVRTVIRAMIKFG